VGFGTAKYSPIVTFSERYAIKINTIIDGLWLEG